MAIVDQLDYLWVVQCIMILTTARCSCDGQDGDSCTLVGPHNTLFIVRPSEHQNHHHSVCNSRCIEQHTHIGACGGKDYHLVS